MIIQFDPIHKYPNIFENASTCGVFESFSPVHTKTLKRWKYDSIPHRACVMLAAYDLWHHRIQKPPFLTIHKSKRSQRFQKSPLRRAFLKRCVLGDRVHRMAKPEKKKTVFKQKRKRVDGAFDGNYSYPKLCKMTESWKSESCETRKRILVSKQNKKKLSVICIVFHRGMSHQGSYKNILGDWIRPCVLHDIARSHFCYLQTSPQELPWRQKGKGCCRGGKTRQCVCLNRKNVAVVNGWQL